MNTSVVEPMRWWHLGEVVELERALFPEDAWSAEQFWQELAHATRSYVVAVDSGDVVGYAGAFILAPDSDLQTVAVAQQAQGLGLAARMIGVLIDEARTAGCTHMILEVREDNSRAISLYQRLGYERISQRVNYYPDGGSALIMRRRLDLAR
jgi:ribosomal-protein-alanine N-acetyltransferase